MGRDTPSEDSESSDDNYRRRERPRSFEPKGILKNRYEGGAYTYQYPPSPVWSPGTVERERAWKEREVPRESRESRESREERPRERRKHAHGHGHRDREREREKEREREREREKEKKGSRWKENLTAAGIGGAAASLLNVLTEAAEGL